MVKKSETPQLETTEKIPQGVHDKLRRWLSNQAVEPGFTLQEGLQETGTNILRRIS